MSNISRFLKPNKKVKKNGTYPATKSLTDENGKPLDWTFKPISSKENDRIKDECTIDVQVKGKPNLYRPKLDTNKYLNKMVSACTVEPDLYNKELQDSYGVKTPEELLYAMVDDPGEYSELCVWVQKYQGFNTTMDDKVDEAKN